MTLLYYNISCIPRLWDASSGRIFTFLSKSVFGLRRVLSSESEGPHIKNNGAPLLAEHASIIFDLRGTPSSTASIQVMLPIRFHRGDRVTVSHQTPSAIDPRHAQVYDNRDR